MRYHLPSEQSASNIYKLEPFNFRCTVHCTPACSLCEQRSPLWRSPAFRRRLTLRVCRWVPSPSGKPCPRRSSSRGATAPSIDVVMACAARARWRCRKGVGAYTCCRGGLPQGLACTAPTAWRTIRQAPSVQPSRPPPVAGTGESTTCAAASLSRLPVCTTAQHAAAHCTCLQAVSASRYSAPLARYRTVNANWHAMHA